ncbi:hypothetical protein BT96DRAFT_1008880 [Gymnopus androsaceus JB14]|uniref:Uncharacterized protein n=1 Tax=Gymnopus androsaceus JB14 TaxID=1447944 RepID=A0A6A4GDW0_9AGAR|nr:hypothetical protein BT96DRAFT_1008880 [Gymnopus androsaceus JB14]
MTTRPTMEWSSLIMGSQSSTLTMESQSSSSTCSTEQKPILAGEPKLPDPLADLTLAFFSLRSQDVALGALKFYNFILRNKDVLFFSKPEARGLRLETQTFAYKVSDSFLFLCPNPYDMLHKEYYLGWFHVTGAFVYSSLAEVELSPTYPDFDVTSFRCKWGNTNHIDLYSTMMAHKSQQWVDAHQSCELQLRFHKFNMKQSLKFMTSDCETCRGTHRGLSPYQKHYSQSWSSTAKRLNNEVVCVELVAEIISHVRSNRFILIEVPPCLGKSTLLDQIWEALLMQAPLRTWADSWLGINVDGSDLADFMMIKDRRPLWICFDEVQRTYGDTTLWAALYIIAIKTNTFVIAAGSFGSHTGSTSHSPSHMVSPEHRMILFNQKDEQLSLAFTQNDIDEYRRCLKAPELGSYWNDIRAFASPCVSNVGWNTGAHPGVVTQMARHFIGWVKQIKQQNPSIKAIPFQQLVEDFTSQCLLDASMEITADLGRCIPRPPSHCHNFPPPALLVFHTILEQGKILVPTIDTKYSPLIVSNDCRIWDQISSSPRIIYWDVPAEYRTQDVQPPTSSVYITLAHGMIKTVAIAVTPRLRFLEVVPGTPGYKSYALCEKHTSDEVLSNFAQAAHDARRMGWLLQVPSVAGATLITLTFESFSSIDDLLCCVLVNFSTRVLTGYCRDQGNVRPGYAKEECVTSNRDGFVDMQIKSKRWLFEFLVEGNNSIEHVEWFLPNGVYNNSWPHYKWRVIDFRIPAHRCAMNNQFIDLEAQVNTDDEFSSDDENGDRDDFLDDAEEVESLLPKQKSFALPEQRPRADALFPTH